MKSFIQTLKDEHQTVKNMIQQLQQGEGGPEDILSQLQQALDIHMNGEEKLFYPLLEQQPDMKEKALEAYEEHHVARLVLKELVSHPRSSERWMAKLQVFQEILEHHIEEEEGNIFPASQQSMSEDRQNEIAEEYEALKGERMAAAH